MGFVMVIVLTSEQTQETLEQQVHSCDATAARQRVLELLAKQAESRGPRWSFRRVCWLLACSGHVAVPIEVLLMVGITK